MASQTDSEDARPVSTSKGVLTHSKPLRKQVSRACDQCRSRRIKCDNERPCRGCIQRGVQCAIRGGDEPVSLPQALKEIESLRSRIRSLESEVESCRGLDDGSLRKGLPTPSDCPDGQSPGTSSDDPSDSSIPTRTASRKKFSTQWEGIYVATLCSEQTYLYGPSSGFYFISRIGGFLGKALQQPVADRSMQPHGTTKSLATSSSVGNEMSRAQEECFVALFWESYHCLLPIVNEAEFRAHYEVLWEGGRTRRRASPLVDIVLALCLQYGYTFIPRSDHLAGGDNSRRDYDGTIAGRWYYKRCQSLLVASLESPSMVTVQCQIFSIVYLCCASFQNMAHIMLAILVRTAQLLGLHLEPLSALSEGEKELRRMTWLVIFSIESKTNMKLGRSSFINLDEVTVEMPSDMSVVAGDLRSSLGMFGPDVSWLTYTCQIGKLVQASTRIYTVAWEAYGSILGQRGLKSPYRDLAALELCAEQLSTLMTPFREWASDVPKGMRLQRQGGGQSFSTACHPLDIDSFAPTWLQRQRILLELTYHTMVINLYRPFITFSSASSPYTPHSTRHASSAVQHAIAHSHIMHQAVSETDLLNGWNEFFLTQWNATITIIGFILAYPVHPSTPSARKTVDKCIAICDLYGSNFAVARSAAGIARDLVARADELMGRIRAEVAGGASPAVAAPGTSWEVVPLDEDGTSAQLGEDAESWGDFMDWALTVDTFNSFEEFYGTGVMEQDGWWNIRQ